MSRRARFIPLMMLLVALFQTGCRSPYHADRGAFWGGLLGAGTGAIVGNQSGNSAEGALVGGAVGALAGTVIGSSMDEMEARNRVRIEQRLGRRVRPGAVTIDSVISMSKAGVEDELIINHIHSRGMAAPLTGPDLILLEQQEVSTRVVAAMQKPPVARQVSRTSAPVPTSVRPVIIEEHYYQRPWPPRPHHNGWSHCGRCRRSHGPGAHVKFSFGH